MGLVELLPAYRMVYVDQNKRFTFLKDYKVLIKTLKWHLDITFASVFVLVYFTAFKLQPLSKFCNL